MTPTATAVGCSSIINISGAGFAAAGAGLVPVCSIGELSTGAVVVVNDSLVSCKPPGPAFATTAALRLDFGGATASHPDVMTLFVVYEAAAFTPFSILPVGGRYNLQMAVTLVGSGFTNFGAPRCRFGSFEGDPGVVINSTHLSCSKPRFPDSERISLGGYSVAIAANGQCYSAPSVQFTTYNSQLDSIDVFGAPSTSSINLTMTGEGFVTPVLLGAVCEFQMPVSSTTITTIRTALTTLSSSSASCPTPAGGTVGTWSVSVLQNGLTAEHTVSEDS